MVGEAVVTSTVIIHKHKPTWRDSIEQMRLNGNKAASHLYQDAGSYLGTWQRIDIPDFVYSEYCLLLDYDTIVVKPFGMIDFGLDITPTIALSAEMDEYDPRPWNAGVTVMNVPYLRETKEEFHKFIFEHQNGDFQNGPSDQGAYNDFYSDRTFLHRKFNMKPYWENEDNWRDRYIIHFHGMKPMDILDLWLFGKDCNPSIKFLCDKEAEYKFLCPSMQSFAVAATLDDATLDDFCGGYFDSEQKQQRCKGYLNDLAGMALLPVGSSCKPSK